MVPHAIDILMNKTQTQHMTNARLTRYELILLAPHIMIKRCNSLNPATMLPLRSDDLTVLHDCILTTEEETKGRVDLTDIPLSEPDGTLYVDGLCFKLSCGSSTAAYAITTLKTVVESCKIPQHSAEAAEIIALTRACELSLDLRVNTYTDSQYAFGVAHNFGKLWAERGFLTSPGTKIQHGMLITRLLNSLVEPRKLAIIKCSAHKKVTNDVGIGNAFADRTAKLTAQAPATLAYVSVNAPVNIEFDNSLECVRQIQADASKEELEKWNSKATLDDGCYVYQSDRRLWMLPDKYVSIMLTMAHGHSHICADAIVALLGEVWYNTNIWKTAVAKCKNCITCLTHNIGKGTPVPSGHFRPPELPSECLQMDFIEMPLC
ncbi:uncharacterized protein [Ambystoma mexicanum]|uniref:uncharacterized protein n=1 Tax=Ambystoma mexicanum TaxID=8296 RepID=UPI0037E7789F